jgi:hypothetical protein
MTKWITIWDNSKTSSGPLSQCCSQFQIRVAFLPYLHHHCSTLVCAQPRESIPILNATRSEVVFECLRRAMGRSGGHQSRQILVPLHICTHTLLSSRTSAIGAIDSSIGLEVHPLTLVPLALAAPRPRSRITPTFVPSFPSSSSCLIHSV